MCLLIRLRIVNNIHTWVCRNMFVAAKKLLLCVANQNERIHCAKRHTHIHVTVVLQLLLNIGLESGSAVQLLLTVGLEM